MESNIATVRLMFLRGCSVMGEVPSEEVVNQKVATIMRVNPRKWAGYAYMSGRNWAIGEDRARKVLARRAVKEEAKHQAETAAAMHTVSMRRELGSVIARMDAAAADKPHLSRYASALDMAYLCNIPARLWGSYHPNVKLDTLYQIKCRAVKHAAKFGASAELKAWLDRQVR